MKIRRHSKPSQQLPNEREHDSSSRHLPKKEAGCPSEWAESFYESLCEADTDLTISTIETETPRLKLKRHGSDGGIVGTRESDATLDKLIDCPVNLKQSSREAASVRRPPMSSPTASRREAPIRVLGVFLAHPRRSDQFYGSLARRVALDDLTPLVPISQSLTVRSPIPVVAVAVRLRPSALIVSAEIASRVNSLIRGML